MKLADWRTRETDLRVPKVRAREQTYFFAARVRAALIAAAERSAGERFRAVARACFERASLDAAPRPSRLSALSVACERFRDGFFAPSSFAFWRSRFAFFLVSSGTVPFSGGGSFTPARRALERPMAIACFVERAPCSPLRMASISSRTNSPACVEGASPSRLSFRAMLYIAYMVAARLPIF